MKNSKRLKKVSKKLSKPFNSADFMKNFYNSSKGKSPVNDLIDIALSDSEIQELLVLYKADRQTLENLYDMLCLAGAGQFAEGHFVAASSIVFPETLKYMLENYDGQNFAIQNQNSKSSSMYVAFKLIKYFEGGRKGEL